MIAFYYSVDFKRIFEEKNSFWIGNCRAQKIARQHFMHNRAEGHKEKHLRCYDSITIANSASKHHFHFDCHDSMPKLTGQIKKMWKQKRKREKSPNSEWGKVKGKRGLREYNAFQGHTPIENGGARWYGKCLAFCHIRPKSRQSSEYIIRKFDLEWIDFCANRANWQKAIQWQWPKINRKQIELILLWKQFNSIQYHENVFDSILLKLIGFVALLQRMTTILDYISIMKTSKNRDNSKHCRHRRSYKISIGPVSLPLFGSY